MNGYIAVLAASLLLVPAYAHAESIPEWIKNSADWWAQGQIDDDSFVQSIQYLIEQGILTVPETQAGSESADGIPQWVRSNAGWWAQGQISDSEFVNAIQHLIKTGIITVGTSAAMPADTAPDAFEAELAACDELVKIYEQRDCKKVVEHKMTVQAYKQRAVQHPVGPVTFYWMGLDSEGNSLEISDSGQAILAIRMLAENAGSDQNISMMCTGPAICNYDISDGSTDFKYAGTDFTNGQIILKPGEAREFNMLFGPSIGYGGNTFEYDPAKEYHFQVSEPWGSARIPLELK